MGDTNRTSLKYLKESSWGTAPTGQSMTEIRMTGESLGFNISNIVSNELRSDRQTTDLVQTSAEATGGFNGEVSFDSYDEFLQGALWATPANGWQGTVQACSATIEFSASSSAIIDSANSDFSSLITGQWVRLSGASYATNSGYFFITSTVSASHIVVAQTLEADPEGDDINIEAGGVLRNNTQERSYSIQRAHEDMSPIVYFHFLGMVINSMTVNVETEQISTVSFDFIGKDTTASGTLLSTAGTDSTIAQTDVLNAVSHVANIREGDMTTDETAIIRALNFTLANNIRGKKGIGYLGNADVGAGKIDVTGTMSVYFTDKALYDKYTGGTETSLTFKLEDSPSGSDNYGNAYIFTFPRIKFESDGINAGGADADVMEEIGWRAIRNATYDCTVQIDKFDSSI